MTGRSFDLAGAVALASTIGWTLASPTQPVPLSGDLIQSGFDVCYGGERDFFRGCEVVISR